MNILIAFHPNSALLSERAASIHILAITYELVGVYSQTGPRHLIHVGEGEEAVTWRAKLELIFKIAAELKEEKVCTDLLCDTVFVHSVHAHVQAMERSQ